jgi:integral membrane protein|tara:strand:- start:665 stop:940 length:276 start_codon:yes stop_codon:yes gene_type:complete
MKNIFRIISFLEGVSYILLMTVGLYFKYQLDDPTYVKLLGMPHGLLFVSYLILAFFIKNDEKWNKTEFGIIIVASIVPFGTFYVDRKYLNS